MKKEGQNMIIPSIGAEERPYSSNKIRILDEGVGRKYFWAKRDAMWKERKDYFLNKSTIKNKNFRNLFTKKVAKNSFQNYGSKTPFFLIRSFLMRICPHWNKTLNNCIENWKNKGIENLRNSCDDWKRRVEGLMKKFSRIGPGEFESLKY